MSHLFLLPPLSAQDLLALQRILRATTTSAGLYRRSNLIWQLAAGASIAEASQIAQMHYTNAHKWTKRFREKGLEALRDKPRSGRPKRYTAEVETRIIEIVTSHPKDLGLMFTTWSLPKLEEFFRQMPETSGIGFSTIRRILERHGLRFLTGETWCESHDPDFEVKKTP
jgi:transposase